MERKHSSNITCVVGRSTETSLSHHPTGGKYRDDVRGAVRSVIPMVRVDASLRNVANPSRKIGPIAYFYHAIPSTDLSCILAQHITPEVPKNSRRTFFRSCYSMRLSQAIFAISSLTIACEAFRFSVWLGDKCTISGTGTRPSDQELLVIPQTMGDDGCMVRALANIRSTVCMH
jgi:hypothetical protein